MQVMVELRPLLRQYAVHPKFVDNPGIENGEQAQVTRACTAYTSACCRCVVCSLHSQVTSTPPPSAFTAVAVTAHVHGHVSLMQDPGCTCCMHTVRRPDQPFCADVLHGTALPEMLASRLLPEQVEQEAAWKAAMPGGLQQLVTEPRLCLEYANNLVRGC